MFDKVMSFLKELNSTTLMILVFAAILVIFLLILIIVTVKVLKSGNDADDKDESHDYDEADGDEETEVLKKKKRKKAEAVKGSEARSDEEDTDDDEDEEDEDSSDEDDEDEYEEDDEDEEEEKVSTFKSGFSTSLHDASTDEALKVAEQINNEVAATMSAQISEAFASAKSVQTAEESENSEKTSELPSEAPLSQPDNTVSSQPDDTVSSQPDDTVSSQLDEKTNELDTTAIKRALREEKNQVSSQKAASEAESASYNAKMDSAFIDGESAPTGDTIIAKPANKEGFVLSDEDIENATETALAEHNKVVSATEDKITVNPVNAVNINTVNTVDRVDTKSQDAGIESMEEMESFLTENPVPKKKKKKVKKRDQAFEDKFEDDNEDIRTGEYFWYNSQDIDGLKRKEDMYYYCHYFNNPAKAVIPLVTEMYDCAFVRTEEIQKIAYGISFRSMKMKEILAASDVIGFDKSKATKEPSEKDMAEIYRKWCGYVDNFFTIIVINAPDNVKDYLKKALYDYGKSNDIETLLYSPE